MKEIVKKVLEKIFLDDNLANEFLNLEEDKIYEFCLNNSEEFFTEYELKKYGLEFFEELYSNGKSKTKISEEDLKNVSGGVSTKKSVAMLTAISSIISSGISASAYNAKNSQNLKITPKTILTIAGGTGAAASIGALAVFGFYKYFKNNNFSQNILEKRADNIGNIKANKNVYYLKNLKKPTNENDLKTFKNNVVKKILSELSEEISKGVRTKDDEFSIIDNYHILDDDMVKQVMYGSVLKIAVEVAPMRPNNKVKDNNQEKLKSTYKNMQYKAETGIIKDTINADFLQKDKDKKHLVPFVLSSLKDNFSGEFVSQIPKNLSNDNIINGVKASFKHKFENYTIEIETKSNIVKCPCDAIVNAANEGCLGGNGVDYVFVRTGGDQLSNERSALKEVSKGVRCLTGSVRVTGTGNICNFNEKAKYILHTVGPRGSDTNKEQKLYSAYYNCLVAANRLGCQSIGFPSLSTGIFGYKVEEASKIAMNAVINFFEENKNSSLKTIRWCLYDNKSDILEKNFKAYIAPFLAANSKV